MAERIEQRRVALADLISGEGYEGQFVRRAGESLAGRRARLLEQEVIQDGEPGKIAAYERAVAHGAKFPPAFVFALNGELVLDDGWRRCAAAALSGQRSVSAVIFKLADVAEADALSTMLYDLEAAGLTWQERTKLAVAWLKAREWVAA